MSTAHPAVHGGPGGSASRRVALIVMWRGPFPSYFDLFLESCAANPDYTWLIFTDRPRPEHAPANVRFLPLSDEDLHRRIADALGVEARITWPYKFCDLRPMFGLLFADHLREFTHWGHCDLDVIWGRLRDFLTDDLVEQFPRVQEKGHLAIYRNTEDVNRLFMLEAPGVATWRDVLAHPDYYFYFDEWSGINRILAHHRMPRAPLVPVADVLAVPARYRLYDAVNHRLQAFSWQDGRIVRDFVDDATGRLGRDEFAYIHLQKRKLPPPPFRHAAFAYYITPRGFVPRRATEPDRETIMAMNRPSWRHGAFVARWRAGNLWRKLMGRDRPPAGSGHGLRRSVAGLLAIAFIAAGAIVASGSAGAAEPVRLPQDHDYQVVLRDYLSSLREADFQVSLDAVDLRERWLRDDESLYRLWVLAQSFPDSGGLLIAADNFLLRTIESPDGIRIRAGNRGGDAVPGIAVHPEDTVWWSTWDYEGNPHRGSRAVRNRAFVVAAVDMIMLDKLHESGNDWVKNARRSDFLGGTLSWLAQVYHHVRPDLPEKVRTAYETGLAKFVDRLAEWGPTGVNENMDTKALVAAAYLAATFREGPIVEKARAYANRALKLIHPAGMVRDAGGLEASYNGCAAFNVAWATAVTPWPEFLTTQRRMADLKAHLTLPEPDGVNFWGPSHFSTRTSADSPNDQWAFPQRDLAIAMRANEALYLMYGGRYGRAPGWAVPDRAAMARDVRAAIDRLNASWKHSAARFTTWEASWWSSGRVNFAFDHYRPDFYGVLRRLQEERNPVAVPPIVRPGAAFVRVFPPQDMPDVAATDRDAFVVARFPAYAAIVYTGPMGWHSYMNFAGGCLSAFWTPASGSVVLGRNGNPVEPEKSRQTWADWRLWPTHALSGQTASGHAFSSARIRRRAAVVTCKATAGAATITFAGPIGKQHDESRAAQDGCIIGDVRYSRSLGLGPRGVVVESRIESDGTDTVTDLCEIIPLPLHDEKWQAAAPGVPGPAVPHRVVFRVGDEAVAPGPGFVEGVTAVEVNRFFGGIVIRFEEPQRVRLGEIWTDTYQSSMSLRNLLVDLLGGRKGPGPLPSASVRYRIEPLPPPAAP